MTTAGSMESPVASNTKGLDYCAKYESSTLRGSGPGPFQPHTGRPERVAIELSKEGHSAIQLPSGHTPLDHSEQVFSGRNTELQALD